MSEPVPIQLGMGSNESRHGEEGLTEFVNAYVENLGEGGKVQWPIYAINGLAEFGDELTNGGAIRAMLAVDATLLIVSGRQLFTTNIDGSPMTLIGGIDSDGFTTIARNRQTPNPQVVIVSDGQWYIYQGGTLTLGSDSDLPPPSAVVEFNGYFVFLIPDGRWFISGIDDTTVDGLDFTSASSSADANVMAAVRGRELVIFGERSTEWYVDNAADDFPFSRMQTASIGCYAAGSVAKIILQPGGGAATDSVIWAATDHKGGYSGIMVMNGYTGTKISTSAIDRLLRDEPDPTSIRSFAWTEDGHSFYCISGTSFSRCWDSTTGKWHTRKSYGLERWRPSCHAQIGQTHIFGDYATNLLYSSSPTTYTDADDPIVWTVIPPPVHMFPNPFRVNALYVDALTGFGANSGNDEDDSPQMMISYSDDGGATFGGERLVDLGADGQRYVSIKERAFGRFGKNGVSWKFSCSAGVIKGLMQASLDVDKLKA